MFGKKGSRRERREYPRRAFPHYMQFKNDRTGELVGDLADISLRGFRLEGMREIPRDTDFNFRVDLPPDSPGRGSIVVKARSRWVQPHPVDPRMYVTGYEIKGLDPGDHQAYQFMYDRYGSTETRQAAGNDYVWQN